MQLDTPTREAYEQALRQRGELDAQEEEAEREQNSKKDGKESGGDRKCSKNIVKMS